MKDALTNKIKTVWRVSDRVLYWILMLTDCCCSIWPHHMPQPWYLFLVIFFIEYWGSSAKWSNTPSRLPFRTTALKRYAVSISFTGSRQERHWGDSSTVAQDSRGGSLPCWSCSRNWSMAGRARQLCKMEFEELGRSVLRKSPTEVEDLIWSLTRVP